MYERIRTKTPPPRSVVAIAEAKAQLRLPEQLDDEDDLVRSLILGAEAFVERQSGAPGLVTEYEQFFSCFPNGTAPLRLYREPVDVVSEVAYATTPGGAYVPFSDYFVRGAYVIPDTGWPADVRYERESVRVTYTAGHDIGDDVDPRWKQAVLLMVSHYYANREAASDERMIEIPFGVCALVRQVRRA